MTPWITLKRIFRSGFISFWRNGSVSISAVLGMAVTLFVVGMIVFIGSILTQSLDVIKDRFDINVYFTTSAPETDILDVQKALETLPEVEFVDYVSREQALVNFTERHKNDQKTLEALNELDDNPLGAILNIKATETSQYESIARFLEENYGSEAQSILIDKINYFQNKEAIDTLTQIIDSGKSLGFAVMIIFIIISLIITFNTIRLIMYISRDEIKVMNLVGADDSYVTGPFVVAGALYGVIAGIFTLILFYPLTYWMAPLTESLFFGINIFQFYLQSFAQMFMIIFFTGILIGALASYLAVKKYLKQ